MPTALGFDGMEKGGWAVVGEDGSAVRLSWLVSVHMVCELWR